MRRGRLEQRLRMDRAQRFDRMVDRADPGREPQPHRRVRRDPRIENDGLRDHLGMKETLLEPLHDIGATGDRGELAPGKRGRDRDRAHRKGSDFFQCRLAGPQRIERLRLLGVRGEA